MTKPVKFRQILATVHRSLEAMPEHRKGRNIQYTLKDAGLSAFSVFYLQAPSFLAHQKLMKQKEGRDNAQSLFGIEKIPSDQHIRNLLDPVAPDNLREPFWDIYHLAQASGHLDNYRHVAGTYLCSMDGTWYFSSETIHCPNCTVYEHQDRTLYAHLVMAAVLSAPGQPHVLALEPEFIMPQDGHDKQDCEQQAIKRWVKRNAERFEPWSVTVLADDLHSHQPLCEVLVENKFHFILTCKPESHATLYQELELLTKVEGAHQTHTLRRWKRGHYEQWRYHWVNDVPLRTGKDVLRVNWCEVTVVREDTGERVYHNAWITLHELTANSVEDVADAGRARWKVENEGFNVLKNQGYAFEHNFGHGNQHLSAVLLTMLFLAFLFHSVLHLTCTAYQAIRQALGARREFFNHVRTLTCYLYFPNWDELMAFMVQKLELEPA
jgi:hypothetical protein